MNSTNEAIACACRCDCADAELVSNDAVRDLRRPSAAESPMRGEPNVRAIGGLLAAIAVVAGVALMLGDIAGGLAGRPAHAPASAAPLLIVGAAFMTMLPLTRPGPIEWIKRAMVGAAFLLWGVAQLMPPGVAATTLGDLVITLYVIDLALVIRDWRVTGPSRL